MLTKLEFLQTGFSVCQLPPTASWPTWAGGGVLAMIRSPDELTVIAPSSCVPKTVQAMHGFVCFRVAGELAFDVVGVLAAISQLLADAQIPILAISTYSTDYFLLPEDRADEAIHSLRNADYTIHP